MKAELVPVILRAPHPDTPRSKGIHVSKVIRSLAVQNGALKREWVDPEDVGLVEAGVDAFWDKLDSVSRLRMSIGLAWEQWYIPQLGDVTFHPGEMQVDGIYMTHDGESLDVIITPEGPRYELAVHEVKATYKSTKTVGNLESQWMWVTQTKSYCKGLGTRIAYVHVLFLCGDYSRPIQPQLKCWRLEFDQEEIDTTWDVITTQVRHQLLLEREDLLRDTE